MRILRARVVLPVGGPEIDDGAVAIEGAGIARVGRWADLRTLAGSHHDLGEVALLPGLINAHCHLDYTLLRGAILANGSFSDWIRRLNQLKRTLDDDDYLASIRSGFAELLRCGCTTVFNIESFPELMVRIPPPPLRTWWFCELLDIRSRRETEEVVAGALTFFETRPGSLERFGLSPHSPYTTSIPLYRLVRACAETYRMPVMTHVAESDEEFEMFTRASGRLHQFLRGLGRDMSDTGGVTPLAALLAADALPDGALLTHMNQLGPADEALLAVRGRDFTIVHCPNCHGYFGRAAFPYDVYRRLRIPVCLGTDSCASNSGLDLFAEMRRFRRTFPSVAPDEVLRMVTAVPARAIGMAGRLGVLAPLAAADLIAVPCTAGAGGAAAAVIDHAGPVPWVMINGREMAACR